MYIFEEEEGLFPQLGCRGTIYIYICIYVTTLYIYIYIYIYT
jgi:hypothetical protein